jgi:hypothetical protein
MPEGMPGRKEAGGLALDLAKEVQGLIAEGALFRDQDQIVYEALLYAGREFPSEVGQIALQLGARCDEPDHAAQRRIESQKRKATAEKEWLRNHPEVQKTKYRPISPCRHISTVR